MNIETSRNTIRSFRKEYIVTAGIFIALSISCSLGYLRPKTDITSLQATVRAVPTTLPTPSPTPTRAVLSWYENPVSPIPTPKDYVHSPVATPTETSNGHVDVGIIHYLQTGTINEADKEIKIIRFTAKQNVTLDCRVTPNGDFLTVLPCSAYLPAGDSIELAVKVWPTVPRNAPVDVLVEYTFTTDNGNVEQFPITLSIWIK